jgi:hypothetical protein
MSQLREGSALLSGRSGDEWFLRRALLTQTARAASLEVRLSDAVGKQLSAESRVSACLRLDLSLWCAMTVFPGNASADDSVASGPEADEQRQLSQYR